MAQTAGQSGGKTHWELHHFGPRRSQSHQCYESFGLIVFQWGMVAKHGLNPKNFYYASTLTAAQVAALPEEIDGKNRLASEQILISNLYLCLGEKGQDELHKRKPHLDLSTTRYSRVLDTIKTEFKKERHETYETLDLLARKQHIGESLEQFYSVLGGLAARCNFGTLETRILRDVFIVNMNNREAQNELCRSTKTPEEVYRIELSYERGYKMLSHTDRQPGEQQLVAPPGLERENCGENAVETGPITERRIAFPAGQLNLVKI